MTTTPLRATAAAVANGAVTAASLLRAARDAALRHADLNPIAHADWDAAERAAAAIDALAPGARADKPLLGLPISVKDLFSVRGMPTRAGTRAPLPDLGGDESTLVTRLRDAGAVIFAKTNMHEIALGATGENRWTGDVKNPHDPARMTGGSSSGAAACVATGIGAAAIGSDTGGSVRIPAALCGVTGFKPSYGAIPLDAALYLSWTCDHAGPLARSVDDCALLYEVMSGRRADHGAVPRAPRLAVPRKWLAPRLADPVRERFERTLAALEAAGAQLEDVDSDAFALAWTCYTPIVRAEAAYVHRAALARGGEGFSEMVLPPMVEGGRMSALAYLEAMHQREQVRAAIAAILAKADAIVLPTTSTPAPLRGQVEVDAAGATKISAREALLGQTVPFSLVGLPALSVPTGSAAGLPAALQIVGAADADARVLALGRWVEARVA
ncbi:MAG: amidase [Burkholderiaceae bacterium]